MRIMTLALLTSLSGILAAAVNPDLVKGRYFFVQYAQDSQAAYSTTGLGTIDFGTTTLTFRLQTNSGSTSSGTGTWGIDDDGRIGAASNSTAFAGFVYGIPSSDGLMIAGGQDPMDSSANSNFFFAIKAPTDSAALSDLNGTFSFVQIATLPSSQYLGYIGYTCSVGKMTFDGAGQMSFTHSYSDTTGQISQRSGSGTYTIDSTGGGVLTVGTNQYAIGLSADRRTFLIATINNTTSSAVLIGMKDITGVTPGNSRSVGAYALIRMAPDYVGLDVSRNVPYSANGYITPNGSGSFDGMITERRPVDYVGPVFDEPFSGRYSVASDGRATISLSQPINVGFRHRVTGYQIPDTGALLGAVLGNGEDHGILIGFRSGSVIKNGGVVDAASFKSPVAPGSIISIFGVGLGPWMGLSPGFQGGTNRLQSQASGFSLTVNGIPCPLYFISFSQVNCQMPFEVSDQERVSLVATYYGVSSPTEFARIVPVAPRMFSGAVANAITGRLISQAVPARPGDYLVFYVTGLGQVTGGGVTGQAATATQAVTASFQAQINGRDVGLDYAGLTPGFVGLYQINVRLPNDTSPGVATFSFTLRTDSSVGFTAAFPVGN